MNGETREPPKGRQKVWGTVKKSIDSFHLDHIRVFADAECLESGWCKRGRVFSSPLHSGSPPLSPLSFSPPTPLTLTGSESHPKNPIPSFTGSKQRPRSSIHPSVHYFTLSYLVCSYDTSS